MNFIAITFFLKTLLIIALWGVSELVLYNAIKKSKTDDTIWLVLNIILPVLPCIIYKLTHRTTVKAD
ncbi:MAG: hypothetical protein E7262_10850 [Lachnospiraceae bacterium]|nr:hypothetical protein [Lachnospiraceae bacterium]